MARQVSLGSFQKMQKRSGGPTHTAIGEMEASGDANTNGQNGAALDPLTGQAAPPKSVTAQLRELVIGGHRPTDDRPLDEVAKRLRARASLLDIPAMDEEIMAEARRRCGMLPEPSAVVHPLGRLVLQDDVSGMPLGQVVGLVRLAVQAAHVNATESEIRDEADRRWQAAQPEPDAAADILAEKHGRGLHAGFMIGGCAPCIADASSSSTTNEDQKEEPVEPKPEDQAELDPAPSMGAQLRALLVGSRCSEEMSLGMVINRVRTAATEAGLDPAEAEIVEEGERIFSRFDANRTGPRVYEVDPAGTVRDWRRPETTPDRGDVTAHHTITDDADPRFSGGGAEDSQQQSLFMVPSDADFRGKLYRDAPELANLAETLIERHGFLGDLANCEIRWYWKRKTGVSKGRVKIGFMKRASDLLGHFSGADFIGWLSATTARDGKFTGTQIEAAVFHQLCHVGADEKGNWIFQPHDFEGFGAEVRHYGTWTSDLKLGGTAFVAAHQMGLFTEDDAEDDDEDDDGAGTLIHPDGTALNDDEIEAMERHELADDDLDGDSAEDVAAFDADRPTDSDGPAEDDVEPVRVGPMSERDYENMIEDRYRSDFRVSQLPSDQPANPDGPAPDDDDDALNDVPFA